MRIIDLKNDHADLFMYVTCPFIKKHYGEDAVVAVDYLNQLIASCFINEEIAAILVEQDDKPWKQAVLEAEPDCTSEEEALRSILDVEQFTVVDCDVDDPDLEPATRIAEFPKNIVFTMDDTSQLDYFRDLYTYCYYAEETDRTTVTNYIESCGEHYVKNRTWSEVLKEANDTCMVSRQNKCDFIKDRIREIYTDVDSLIDAGLLDYDAAEAMLVNEGVHFLE